MSFVPRSMSRPLVAALVSALAVAGAAPLTAWAEHTRVTNPNALSMELLGRGIFYSFNFDRALNDDLVAGAGIGTVGLKDAAGNDARSTLTLIPAYVNYYFARDQGSLFITGGVTIIASGTGNAGLSSNLGGLTLNSSPVLPTMGIGYENRGDSGFLFRIAAYGIVAQSYTPWVGFTFGYAF